MLQLYVKANYHKMLQLNSFSPKNCTWIKKKKIIKDFLKYTVEVDIIFF